MRIVLEGIAATWYNIKWFIIHMKPKHISHSHFVEKEVVTMTELDIIKELFKSFSSHSQIVLILQDGSRFSGTIQLFDGETITMAGRQLTLPSIASVEPYTEVQVVTGGGTSLAVLPEYKSHWVNIVCNLDGDQKELSGFLFDIRNGFIALVTGVDKVIINCGDILSVSIAQPDQNEEFPLQWTEGEESEFERALLEGKRKAVEEFLGNLEALKEQGYSEEEISYIQRRAKAPVPWGDDDKNRQYNQARRIFEYEGNRHQIVSNLLKQYLNGSAAYYKTRIKAIGLLVDILSEEHPKDLLPLFAKNEDLIRSNGFICLKVATAFVLAGEYKMARMLVDESRTDIDYSDLLFGLCFFEKHSGFDFSTLPGVDAFESSTEFRELDNLIRLPDKNAFIQLLSFYSGKRKYNTFFSLLDLFMPYARNDGKVVSIVKECLLKSGAETYIRRYLPAFPLLWLDRSLTSKFADLKGETDFNVETVSRLEKQCERAATYAFPNELESAVIKRNYELFEVLRGNNSILLSLGYSAEEIDRIRNADADLIRYGNKTTIEKLINLEGNRYHVPESVAGNDFLISPKEVGEILFPILIGDGSGDLVYELFNYSPFIRSKLSGLDQYYIKALVLLDKRDELWELIKDSWLTMNLDSGVLSVAKKLAQEKGSPETASAIGIYEEKLPLNELEIALLSGNIAKLRSLVIDADYLTESGYTVEEIKLLQESMNRSIDSSKTDNLSIANRIYTFQKNKHRTAELYYTLALKESGSLAASGLFSIYACENRYKELCDVYEQYLVNDPISDFAENKKLYLRALYEIGEYEKFYSIWKLAPDIGIDPILVLNVLLRVTAPESEIEELLKVPIEVDIVNKAAYMDCLAMLCQNELTDTSIAWLTRLFNMFFLICDKDDAQVIRGSLRNQLLSFSAPEGNGLTLLYKEKLDYELLDAWVDYLFGLFPSTEEQLLVLGNVIDVFNDESLRFRAIIRARLKGLLKRGIAVPEAYKEYLKPVFKDDIEKTNWLNERLQHSTDIDESDFELFVNLAEESGNTHLLERLLITLSEQNLDYDDAYITAVLRLLCDPAVSNISADTIDTLLKCISPRLGNVKLSVESLAMLYRAYLLTGNCDSAFLVYYILTKGGDFKGVDEEMLDFTALSKLNLSLFEVVRKALADGISDIDELTSTFGHYLRITESDVAGLEAIKDYYNSPAKWDGQALDTLAKYILCKPTVVLYWRLMDAYFSEGFPEKYCVRYHIAKMEQKSFGPVIADIAQRDLGNLFIQIIHAVFRESSLDAFEKSINAINFAVAKKNECLSDKTTAANLITAICSNSHLRDNLQIWSEAVSLAMNIAFIGHVEEHFYALFGKDLKDDLSILHEKYLCKLLLYRPDLTGLISNIISYVVAVSIDTPYKEIVYAVATEATDHPLTPVQRDLLGIVVDNKGNSRDENAVYKYYLQSIVEGTEKTALQVVDQLAYYYPEWSVISDIKKYDVLSGNVDDVALATLYRNECVSIKAEPLQKRVYKAIVNSLPGELYLQSKGFEVESIYEYGIRTLPNQYARDLRTQGDLYKSLDNLFSEEKHPGLCALFTRCIFLRKWEEFLNYHLEDTSINNIIKSDETFRKLLLTKTYEVLKSSILAILDTDGDGTAIIDRVFALMLAAGGINRSKNYLRRIKALDQNDADTLRKVFTLRIESTSLRRNGLIGSAILRIPGNEKVAYLIGLLDSKHLSDIFDNDEVMDALLQMPADKALTIANIYSSFFFKGISNVFTRFIHDQNAQSASSPISDISLAIEDDPCRPFREVYLKSKRIYDNSETPSTVQKRKYASSRAEYLFNAVILSSTNDISAIQPNCIDYLTVFMFLFNKRTTSEMKEYLWHLDFPMLMPSLAVILCLLEQYVSAYKITDQIDEPIWKDAAYQLLYKALYIPYTPEEKEIKRSIQKLIQVDSTYTIGKFVPVKAEQVPIYIEKIEALRTFLDEALSYLSYCGIDISIVTFNQERYEKALSHYVGIGTKDSEAAIELKAPEEEPLIVSQFIDKEDIYNLFENYKDIDAKPYSEKQAPSFIECIGELKYFFVSKRDSTDRKDIARVRDLLRWTYIRLMEETGFTRGMFNAILELLSKDDSISKAQWSAIVSSLNQYFDSADSLQQLSRIVENDIVHLRNIGGVSNANIRLLSSQDTGAWEAIIDSLEDLASINSAAISERDLLDQLSATRRKLLTAQDKNKGTVFSQSFNILLSLLGREITVLRHTPELSISVPEEQENNTLSILWESENNKGTLYAVISNTGGADCGSITLISRINMKSVHRYRINTIYAGERIPFKATFYAEDIVDGKLTWDLEVSYYDSDKGQTVSLIHESSVTVKKGGEPINIGIINTGNPAKGKDFVGRQRELTLLRNHYSDEQQLPSMLIRGLKRSGKSSLIIKLAEELKKQDRFLVAMVDGQSIGGNIKSAFVSKVLDSIRIGYRSSNTYKNVMNDRFSDFQLLWQTKMESSDWIGNLDLFYYELSQLFQRKILIIIDEMESIFYNHRFDSMAQEDSLYAALRSLIQNPGNYVSFIFCGSDTLLTSCLEQRRESQMFQTLQFLEVGRMSNSDIKEIFRKQSKKYDTEFTFDAVDAIWQYTHGLVWYAKLIGYLVVNNILAKDLTVRREVNRSDIATAVQMLINGEIGTDKYDLVDASLNTFRTALVHAMASIMPDYNKEVSVDEIATAMKMLQMEGYKNPRNGEPVPSFDEKQLISNLEFLEKMQFIDANAARTKYAFTAELYRLFFRNDKKLHLFEERSV